MRTEFKLLCELFLEVCMHFFDLWNAKEDNNIKKSNNIGVISQHIFFMFHKSHTFFE